MTTEKPRLLMTYMPHLSANKQVIKQTKIEALKLRTMTLDAGIFYQMRVPSFTEDFEYDDRLARAQAAAIGYVVAPDYQVGGVNSVWLIVLEDDNLWRWSLIEAGFYDVACEDHVWLAEVPQLFLVGQTPVDYEANRIPLRWRPSEQGED